MGETAETTDTARAGESTYVVQVAQVLDVPVMPGDDENALEAGPETRELVAWVDVATVTVPARSKRRKIIGLGLVQSGLKPEVDGEPLRVRVLDASSAHETEVGAVQPEPELRIG